MLEVVRDRGKGGAEYLQTLDAPGPLHRPLPPPEQQVWVLSPAVQPSNGFLSVYCPEILQCCDIGAGFVRHRHPCPAQAGVV